MLPHHPALRKAAAALLAFVVALTTFAAVVVQAPAAGAAGPSTIVLDGHGWGHGRGMGQYGTYGYIIDHGWTAAQVLDHYYGGTHAGTAAQAASRPVDPAQVRVNLVAMNDKTDVKVEMGPGSTPGLTGATGHTVPQSAKAIWLYRSGSIWKIRWSASGCGGPWTDSNGGSAQVTVSVYTGTAPMTLCRPDGVRRTYPGAIRAFYDGTKTRTVNITSAEEYLRGVVPNEMPASWGNVTLDPLKVQSIAARSYLLAGDTRHTTPGGLYADTCDTTMCQVYDGYATNGVAETDSRTDAAIAQTAGQVRLHDGSNQIARTEFSSSTGGYTAGGTFPAVVDAGDDTSINSRHDWRLTKSVAPLEAQCGGDFLRLDITSRNNLPPGDGRVKTAKIVCANQTVTRTGDQIRQYLGLYSDWFSVSCGLEDTYVDATYQLFVGRSANTSERSYWCPVVRSGNRAALTGALAVSDEWAGVQIDGLYRKILGRPADADGRAYWLGRVRAGFHIEDIAAYFYGGPEYFARSGSTNVGYVERLYLDLLGRPADASGRNYWVDLLNRGVLTRSAVAENYYASIESRRSRVDGLYRQILGRPADAGGLAYWSQQLLTLGDVSLAAWLAASQEYFDRVT